MKKNNGETKNYNWKIKKNKIKKLRIKNKKKCKNKK